MCETTALLCLIWLVRIWWRCLWRSLVIGPGGQSEQLSTSEFSVSSVFGRVSRSSPSFQTKYHTLRSWPHAAVSFQVVVLLFFFLNDALLSPVEGDTMLILMFTQSAFFFFFSYGWSESTVTSKLGGFSLDLCVVGVLFFCFGGWSKIMLSFLCR